jgi:hypothetical protein
MHGFELRAGARGLTDSTASRVKTSFAEASRGTSMSSVRLTSGQFLTQQPRFPSQHSRWWAVPHEAQMVTCSRSSIRLMQYGQVRMDIVHLEAES